MCCHRLTGRCTYPLPSSALCVPSTLRYKLNILKIDFWRFYESIQNRPRPHRDASKNRFFSCTPNRHCQCLICLPSVFITASFLGILLQRNLQSFVLEACRSLCFSRSKLTPNTFNDVEVWPPGWSVQSILMDISARKLHKWWPKVKRKQKKALFACVHYISCLKLS